MTVDAVGNMVASFEGWFSDSLVLIWPVTYLLSSVDDIFSIRQPIDTWSTNNWVMPWRSVSHFHGAELQKGFPKGHSTEKHLSKEKTKQYLECNC